MPVAQERQRRFISEKIFPLIRQTTTANTRMEMARWVYIGRRRLQLALSRQMPGGCTTCTVTSISGVKTGTVIIGNKTQLIHMGRRMERSVFYVVAHGSAILSTVAQRIVVDGCLEVVSTSADFVSVFL
jgi:hypothetical protein